MFQRTVRPIPEEVPKIVPPTEVNVPVKLSLSSKEFWQSDVETFVSQKRGYMLATLKEAIMDRKFISRFDLDGALVDWVGVPKEGWYRIDRKRKVLISIHVDDVEGADWRSILRVDWTVAKEVHPLLLKREIEYYLGKAPLEFLSLSETIVPYGKRKIALAKPKKGK